MNQPTAENPIILETNLVGGNSTAKVRCPNTDITIECSTYGQFIRTLFVPFEGSEDSLDFLDFNAQSIATASHNVRDSPNMILIYSLLKVRRLSSDNIVNTLNVISTYYDPVNPRELYCSDRVGITERISILPYEEPESVTDVTAYVRTFGQQLQALQLSWSLIDSNNMIDYYRVTVQNDDYDTRKQSIIIALEPNTKEANYTIKAVDLCGHSGNATTGIIKTSCITETTDITETTALSETTDANQITVMCNNTLSAEPENGASDYYQGLGTGIALGVSGVTLGITAAVAAACIIVSQNRAKQEDSAQP